MRFGPFVARTLLVFSTVIVVSTAMGADVCAELFGHSRGVFGAWVLDTRSPLDSRYDELVERVSSESKGRELDGLVQLAREKIHAVYRLLQEAYYPLAERVVDRIGSKSRVEIARIESDLDLPIGKSDYREFALGPYRYSLPVAEKMGVSPEIESLVVQGYKRNVEEGVRGTNNARRDPNHPGDWNSHVYGQAREFLWSKPDTNLADVSRILVQDSYFPTPVGEYGPEFAERLLRTTRIIYKMMSEDPDLRSASMATFGKSPHLLIGETARGKNHVDESTPGELVPLNASMEGVLSLHQLFTLLLSKRVAGIESGDAALRELISNSGEGRDGLLSEFTTAVPMGFVGPLGLSGHYFAHPFARSTDGRLVLSPEIKKFLSDWSARRRSTKSRCPMAGVMSKMQSKTGIQRLAEAYLHVFENVSAKPNQPN